MPFIDDAVEQAYMKEQSWNKEEGLQDRIGQS